MKKYMIVYAFEDLQTAAFTDDYTEAKNKKMDIECGLGGYAEIYGREEHEDGEFSEYVLLEA